MDFMNFITENMLIIIPLIYILGMVLKGTKKFPDEFIPVILLPVGIIASLSLGGFNADSAIQGVLCVGCATYCNQVFKQLTQK